MKIVVRALALALGAALALPALADDTVTAVLPSALPTSETATVVVAAQLDPVLDVAVVEQAAASDTNALGLPSSVTTGIIFFVIAATLFTVGTDGTTGN